jgi:hypothetical protein
MIACSRLGTGTQATHSQEAVMPQGDELHEDLLRFSDRDDDADDIGGFGGGGSAYDDDDDEEDEGYGAIGGRESGCSTIRTTRTTRTTTTPAR